MLLLTMNAIIIIDNIQDLNKSIFWNYELWDITKRIRYKIFCQGHSKMTEL